MENGLEQVEGGPTWTLGQMTQDGLRYYSIVQRTLAVTKRSPEELVALFIKQGEQHRAGLDIDGQKMLAEAKEKREECIRFMAGLMGAY